MNDATADKVSASGTRIVEVVAGIVFDPEEHRVLLALRRPEQHQGNRWEFPGGKIEAGETPDAALARELVEEIGIVPAISVHRRTLDHAYPEKHVRLHFVDVMRFDGEPAGREGQTLRWVALDALVELRFPDANQPIVDELVASAGLR